MRKTLLFLGICAMANQVFAQLRNITGIVNDDSGKPLPGVTVSATGTNVSAITNVTGAFSINVSVSVTSLTFSYVGYENKTVSIEGLATVNVTLVPSAGNLEGVVVTGYSTVKKTEYAGATSKVSKGKINFVPNASFDQILQGSAPGLLVTAGSGQPGAFAHVQIRESVQ